MVPTAATGPVCRRFVAEARFRVPELPSTMVRRQRLVTPLARSDARLSLVVGSPGAGKSAVLASWVAERSGPTVWLSADPTDADPVRFWAALATAVDRCVEGAGVDTLKRLDEDGCESVDLAAGLAEACSLAPDLAVVLDDFHLAAPASATIAAFIRSLPPGVRLVVGSRRDPAIPIGRLRVQGQLLELRDEDLRFTPGEAHELFEHLGLDLGDDDIAQLVDLTEGWAAGLHLAALSLSVRPDVSGLVEAFAESDRGVADFLMNEVIDAQPADVAEFLLETSVLDSFDGALCQAITGRIDSGQLLQQLHQGHLFVIALDQRSGWYRYHHLFGAFLHARLRATSRERFRHAHLAASTALADHGDLMGAVHQAMAAEDLEVAFSLLNRVTAANMDLESRPVAIDIVRAWLREFGVRHAATEPGAVLECCLVLIAFGAPDNIETWFRRVEQCPLEPADHAFLTALRGLKALHDGEPQAAVDLIGEGLAIQRSAGVRHHWVAQSPVVVCQAQLIMADPVGVARTVTEARQAALPSPLVDSIRFPGYLSWAAVITGDLVAATRHANRAMEAARAVDLDDSNLAWCLPRLTRAAVARENDELTSAHHELESASDIARAAGRPPIIFLATIESARYDLAFGLVDEARTHLDTARAVMRSPAPVVIDQITQVEARLAIDRGDVGAGALVAAVLPGVARVLLDCRLALAEGDASGAQNLLASLDEATLTRRQRVEAKLLAARAQATRDRGAALVSLHDAVRLAADVGLVRLFVDEGAEIYGLLDALPSDARSDAFVSRVLRYAYLPAGPSRNVTQPRLVEPVSERELEVLRYLSSRLTYAEISGHLYVSVNTVKSHVKSIYRKLGVSARAEAVARARLLGLL